MSPTVRKRGIDITPYFHALPCTFEEAGYAEEEIVIRRWCDDGQHIMLMLDCHVSYKVHADEWVDVVELEPKFKDAQWFIEAMARDAEKMAQRPTHPGTKCSGRGTATCAGE